MPGVASSSLPELKVHRSDDDLMAEYSRGRLSALDELVDRYRLPLLRFAYRVVADEMRAEDVVQEAFVRVMQKARSYSARGHFRTWLFAIAANLCKDERRRIARRQECSLDCPDITMAADHASDEVGTDAFIRWQLTVALQALSPEHRIALVLHHCQQFSYEEIAEVIGCPAGTVKSRVHYALQYVRKVMGVQE
jgi:RNA polymerase sigma-70 factor (ECF subfamily)